MTALIAFVLTHLGLIGSVAGGGGGIAFAVGKFGLKGLLSWLGKHREFLILVAIALVAAILWFLFASMRAERDRALEWRRVTCVAAGVDESGKGVKPGACQARVQQLAAFERDAAIASNQVLVAAAKDHAGKITTDAAAADRDRAAATVAHAQMEKANASIATDDHVGGDWFAALNRTAGLRAPPK